MDSDMNMIAKLRDTVQKAFPADRLIPEREASWRLAAGMGLLLSDVPEDLGGLGLGREALTAVCFEQGRILSPAPVIPAALALEALVAAPAFPEQSSWIERICAGGYVGVNLLAGTAKLGPSGRLHGEASGVPEADLASHVLVTTPELQALVPLDAPGVSVIERPTWDRSRRFFDVAFDGAAIDAGLVLARADEAARLHEQLSGSAQLLIAADALGGASAALEATIDYLKVRRQFDRPIAMFQAIKHRCADVQTMLASAEALLWSRSRDASASPVDLGALRAHACTVFGHITEEMIQLHGGIGLTDEHACHLFMKRAMLDLHLCGGIDLWRERAGSAALEASALA
jgi:alkylation response protein AidB-like acyl-CoA dehydrogenase